MAIMTHAKFYFIRLMLTLIFGIWASETPRASPLTRKAGPDSVKGINFTNIYNGDLDSRTKGYDQFSYLVRVRL